MLNVSNMRKAGVPSSRSSFVPRVRTSVYSAPSRVHSVRCSAVLPELANSLREALTPQADLFKTYDLPEALIHWGHPGNMAVVLLAMGVYGSGYLGWQIRTSTNEAVVIEAKDKHPKIALGMTAFFSAGALGGIVSLLMQGKPIFESSHVVSGLVGLSLLYIQAILPTLFAGNKDLRTVHAFLGTSILGLFIVHAGLGLQFGLSLQN